MQQETKDQIQVEVKADAKEEMLKMKMATAFSDRENRDLGFGSVVSRESRQRLINPDGSFNVRRMGLNYVSSLNFFHLSLEMSWLKFLGIVLLLYSLSNVFFGVLYTFCGADALVDSSSSMPLNSLFAQGFFFSVQTFATIGYGTIHPVGFMSNFVVTLESYFSIIFHALVTGLVFARFARPTAMIKFSQNAIVAPYRGGKAFMFRLVNMRASQLIEVNIKFMMVHFVEEDGRIIRRFDSLELERSSVSFFPLALTVVHPIDETSPLHNLTLKDLEKSDAEFLILLTAIDETFAQPVHTRSSYKPNDVVWNAKFINLYRKVQNDEPISIDVRKLSSIEMFTE